MSYVDGCLVVEGCRQRRHLGVVPGTLLLLRYSSAGGNTDVTVAYGS